MSHMMQPSIILLKDGTDTSQGVGQLLSNIDACYAIVDVIKTTLGPRGMDKLIHDGRRATISNDGATILKLLDVVHPAAKLLVDIAKSQDSEVGDGTTTTTILAGEFLKEAKQFIQEGVHPQLIIKAYREALRIALKRLEEIAVQIDKTDNNKTRDLLRKIARTSLSSKLIGGIESDHFSEMVVDSVLSLDDDLDIDLIGVKQVPGGSMQESFLVKGVAFKKSFSYAGFEQQPKKFISPKIITLNIELELKAEKDNAEIKLNNPEQYQSIVDAEWKIIYDKLEKIVASGAKIVLSKKAIGDLATQYFADRGLFCAGRVAEDDLLRVTKATGSKILTTVSKVNDSDLGVCGLFEERQVGNERFNIFTECAHSKTATVVLRGGAEQFIAEAERSLHDAIMVVRRTLKNTSIVAGGGAVEMDISAHLKSHARSIKGKSQLIILAFAKALEIIPRQLSENAGFDATNILNKLRKKHQDKDGVWYGVDMKTEDVADNFNNFVWEPSLIKRNALVSSIEAATLVLSVDETVKNPESEQNQHDQQRQQQMMGGMGNMR
ncbi:chaperone-t-complex eta subunit [Naegleria gruberi]|uniref:T-complex protein 1 subunit eta n=1 Tax=Naegleria gruberi TaxID=5762 RepID=D2V5R6_NAEGR|nr:chaperone-t-complex eta subunit [Naegleria gruberi]EFC47845.1 chaperone-t-complex eta subunit [Naegleria gruberi]|eukprot:XP_002680589.1 chaperone-t-complex eta subunit [Naegleria gruberi strain NEG-M]